MPKTKVIPKSPARVLRIPHLSSKCRPRAPGSLVSCCGNGRGFCHEANRGLGASTSKANALLVSLAELYTPCL